MARFQYPEVTPIIVDGAQIGVVYKAANRPGWEFRCGTAQSPSATKTGEHLSMGWGNRQEATEGLRRHFAVHHKSHS